MIRAMAALALLPAPLLAVPAFAQQAANSAAAPKAAPNLNERVCEVIVPTGSRLGGKRFCATRAEWEDKRRQDRDAIEKAQLSPCVLTHTVTGMNGNGHQAC